MNRKKKEGEYMATLATPKRSSYILKKDSAPKIIESKASKAKTESIKKNAELFVTFNIAKR